MQRYDYAAASPDGMKAFAGVSKYVASCGLEKKLIDLVFLRVSQINGCAYCVDMHTRDLMKNGLQYETIALLPVWREAGVFSEREMAALRWAEAVTLVAEAHVPDPDYEAVTAQFDAKELSDLTIAIGLMNAYNRIAVSARRGPGAKAA